MIVDDDRTLLRFVGNYLEKEGFEVLAIDNGPKALRTFFDSRPNLVFLDVMMPGMDGWEVCARLREMADTPIIMLTAKTADEDIIAGLTLGADDYVAKPFSVAQLVLRVKAVLRRARIGIEAGQTLELVGGACIDLENLSGELDSRQLCFTRRESEILAYLAANSERPVSRDELLNKVWGYDRDAGLETRTVDIHIAKLRRKIEIDPKLPRSLLTVRGAGYRLRLGDEDV